MNRSNDLWSFRFAIHPHIVHTIRIHWFSFHIGWCCTVSGVTFMSSTRDALKNNCVVCMQRLCVVCVSRQLVANALRSIDERRFFVHFYFLEYYCTCVAAHIWINRYTIRWKINGLEVNVDDKHNQSTYLAVAYRKLDPFHFGGDDCIAKTRSFDFSSIYPERKEKNRIHKCVDFSIRCYDLHNWTT